LKARRLGLFTHLGLLAVASGDRFIGHDSCSPGSAKERQQLPDAEPSLVTIASDQELFPGPECGNQLCMVGCFGCPDLFAGSTDEMAKGAALNAGPSPRPDTRGL